MEQYNKHAKIFYYILAILGLVCILLACSYMTQYYNLVLVRSASGSIDSGTVVGDISNNSIWSNYVTTTAAENNLTFLSKISSSERFRYTATIIYGITSDLQTVNNLILYLGVVTIVGFAVCMIFSNGSRRIYYKSNLIVGVLCPAVIAIFAVVADIMNTMVIPDISKNINLLSSMDVAITNGSLLAQNYDMNGILANTRVSILTPVIADIIFVLVIGYCIYMIVYAVKRYKVCATERNQILAKAGIANE